MLTLAAGSAALASADTELASRCFARFVDQTSAFSVTRILAGIWLCATALLLAGDGFRLLAAWLRVRREAAPAPAGGSKLIEEVRGAFDVERSVRLQTTTRIVTPFVFGLLDYRVVVPQSYFSDCESERLRHILLHEMAHVRDRDTLWLCLELICRRFLFFHPLMILLGREYRVTVERAADELAIERGQIQSADFVQTLLAVAEKSVVGALPPLQAGVSAGYREVRSRIEAARRRGRRRRSNISFAVLTLLSISGSLGLSLAQAAVEQQGPPAGEVCRQVQHELMIETWLRIPHPSVRCEVRK
jgi:beta-lactamase regulating signal transducer with metallopeptidase domain